MAARAVLQLSSWPCCVQWLLGTGFQQLGAALGTCHRRPAWPLHTKPPEGRQSWRRLWFRDPRPFPHWGRGGTGDIKLALCQWGSMGRGPSHPTPLHSGRLTTLTWHEPHVERYQALAVVDSSVGPVCSGQPLSLGTDGVSKQELQKCGHGLPPPGKQQPVVPWGGGGGVLFSPPHRLHSREPNSGPGWGRASAHYAGHSGGYLALVKLVHSLCDPITVIQPHHAGKPGDEASIPWGRKRSGCCPRSPSPPTCSLGCWEACPGSFMPLNIGRMGMSRQALQPWGSWAPGREGPVQPSLSSCLGP